jgi:hypothetical protein
LVIKKTFNPYVSEDFFFRVWRVGFWVAEPEALSAGGFVKARDDSLKTNFIK